MNWITLTNTSQLLQLQQAPSLTASKFVVFKHSTRCSTSRMSLKLFESQWKNLMPAYLLHVVENRQVSNEVEKIFGVRHESPQILLISEGKCIFNASHSMIDAEEIEKIAISK
jgi:bacillithiol system protein YtxJ